MIFQSIEEIEAYLLINPSTELNKNDLGANLYFLQPRSNEHNKPDCITYGRVNYTYLEKHNYWIIELTELNQLIDILQDDEFYFDHSAYTKTFTYTAPR